MSKLKELIAETGKGDINNQINEQEILKKSAVSEIVKTSGIDYLEKKKLLELNDIEAKLRTRKWVAIVLFVLLYLQNAIVFLLLSYALISNDLTETQISMFKILLPIIIPATLGETAFAIKIIIQWLFKEIEYPK